MEKAEAQALAEAFKTPRYREIETLERHIDGSIYDGRKPFFVDDGTPLLERRPCCRYPIAKIAIRSHGDMVLGEGKWPRIKAKRTARAAAVADETKKAFEKLVADVVDQAELRSRMREGLELSMGGRSAAFVGFVRRGKVGVQVFSGKSCCVERDADGCIERLTIAYPYLEEYRDAQGKWTWRVCLYKRVVDEKHDTVYVPLVVDKNTPPNAAPTKVDRKKSRDHNLGFCPVVWYAFMPAGGHEDALDGRAIHEEQLADCVTLDIGLSQRARAGHYAGDPQMWEAGVEPDEMPAPTGRGVSPMVLDANGKPLGFSLAPAAPATKRQKGAGVVWSSRNDKYHVGQVTMPGDALQGLDEHIQDLARRIGLALAYVDLEPQKAHSGEKSSGRALEILLKPQVEYDGRIREDFGEHGICAVVSLLLRVAHVANRAMPGGVYLDGLDELSELLDSFERPLALSTDGATEAEGDTDDNDETETGVTGDAEKPGAVVWMPLSLDLEWGPFFADTSADTIKDRVDAAVEASGKLISKRTATASVAHAFGVEDVDAELAQMAAEAADDAEVEDEETNADGSQGGAIGGDQTSKPADGAEPGATGSASAAGSSGSAPAAPAPRAAPTPTGAGKSPASLAAAPKPGKVVPIMPKARAKVADPGGTGSAKLAASFAADAAKTGTGKPPTPEMSAARAGVPTLDGKAHLRAANPGATPATNPGVAETVYDLLKDDYPESAIGWIRSASVEGPRLVPLEQIDFTNRENWSAVGDDIGSYVEKIQNGTMKPIVLVNEPNDEKLMIIDGHHRALAYQKLGAPAMAYVVHVGAISGPWDAMHSSQKNGNGEPMLTSQQKG